MIGPFIIIVLAVMSLLWWIMLYWWFDFNQLDIINKIKDLIWTQVMVANKGLLDNNKLTLGPWQNQLFLIQNKNNIVVKDTSSNSEDYKNIEFKFVNYKNLGETSKTYNIWTDYKIYKCANSNCTFKNNWDFIIYEVHNWKDYIEKINEILVEAVRMQKVELSLLKKQKNWTIDYNLSLQYILKTGDNDLKFPTVILNPGDTLYIKVKIIDDNFSI